MILRFPSSTIHRYLAKNIAYSKNMRPNSTMAAPSYKNAIAAPSYDPTELTPGVVHVGVGNFHRAHMAAYFDDLFNNSTKEDFKRETRHWGIVGAGILSFDADKRKALENQNWRQTLVERDADSTNARSLASMMDFLPVDHERKEHKELRTSLTSPNIKIVSLTVTEGGYFLSDGAFDTENTQILHDAKSPDQPQTIFGILIEALRKRKEAGVAPFTIMSCDNIPHNGDIVKSVVIGLAKLSDPTFAEWIDANVCFPNSMVDRITPATTDAQREFVRNEYGVEDIYPIFCEPFRQWVLEDKFSNGRPPLDHLDGVKFVPDVAPYEMMKIRILNGGHASICYPSALLGVDYVHEAMEHKTIGPFLSALERTEIMPSVPPVPDVNIQDYWKTISKRFSNPTIGDTIPRNCYDGASRQPKFIVPVAQDALKKGIKVDGLALVSAMWCRYCEGVTEAGEPIKPNDPQWDRLHELAKKSVWDPTCWLGMNDVYGKVGKDPVFVEAFGKALNQIHADGVEVTMQRYIAANC